MADAKATPKPSNVEYENIVSKVKISGTVYNQLNAKMKKKYTKVKASKAKKPAEA